MHKVFLSGYAKLPENTTAQKLYSHLVLVVTVRLPEGTILEADCTMATELGRQFIQELLSGYDLHRGPEPLLTLLSQSYYGHLRKALQTCIKGICLQFDQFSRAQGMTLSPDPAQPGT